MPTGNTKDDNRPVALLTVPSHAEAAMVVGALEADDIEATTTGDFTAGFLAEAPGNVSVMVRHCDLARARQTLSELPKAQEQESSHEQDQSGSCSFCSSKAIWFFLAGTLAGTLLGSFLTQLALQ